MFNHVEVNFFNLVSDGPVLFSSGIIRLLNFLIIYGYYLESCVSCGEGSCFFLSVLR